MPRPLAIAVFIAAMLTAVVVHPAAAADVRIPYGRGSVVVPTGSTVRTTCTAAVTHIAVCANGACHEVATYPCSPFGCADGTRCASSCSADASCASGARCNTSQGQCALMLGNTCADPSTVEAPNGIKSSCAPYRCVAGACYETCQPLDASGRSGDCQPGKCVLNPTTSRYRCQ